MPETQRQRKERLQDLGIWEDVCIRRDELKADGVEAGEAARLAEAEVTKAMVSASGGKAKPSGVEPTGAEATNGGAPAAPTEADCCWVLEHYVDPNIKAASDWAAVGAPNPLALGLLLAARKNPKTYQLVFERVTPKTFVAEMTEDDSADLSGLAERLKQDFDAKLKAIMDKPTRIYVGKWEQA